FDDIAKDTLDEWIYYLKNNKIEDDFKAKGLSQARELLDYDKLSDKEKQAYDRVLESRRGERDAFYTARIEGRAEGEAIGVEKGRTKGRKEGLRNVALNAHRVEKRIAEGDEIARIEKQKKCPDYISREEWNNLPKDMLLRRISYKYPTKEGMETAVLYTTLLSERIEKTEIILKYTTRWDIEICIREVKILMDINVLQAKTSDMLEKEFSTSLIAYNLVQHLIYRAAQKSDFPPKKISFANALRLITQFCLTGKNVSSITGLLAEIEKLLTKILKHPIPKHKPNRHYLRKTKKGKYQKYA
ncbi:MAG: transposase, partial [Prevotellaceae bacterium]|nr:transposase [Prevotellaceae bacterium]